MASTTETSVAAETSGQNRGRGAGNTRGRGRGGAGRGRGRGRGNTNAPGGRGGERSQGYRGGGNSRRGRSNPSTSASGPLPENSLPAAQVQPATGGKNEDEDDEDEDEDVEAEVCFICASPVIHQSVAPCNHRTCHICALRMRALYKNKECAHCRVSLFTIRYACDLVSRLMLCL